MLQCGEVSKHSENQLVPRQILEGNTSRIYPISGAPPSVGRSIRHPPLLPPSAYPVGAILA
jgi:hypothetical protein